MDVLYITVLHHQAVQVQTLIMPLWYVVCLEVVRIDIG